tara:strand:- start:15 stop:497 length:483 start_codon:yes stop_codon:yes gene_type:complete
MKILNKRNCEDCNLCCKLPEINYTNEKKGAFKWCTNCDIGKGCKIYSSRPQGCKDFYCLYQQGYMDLKPNKVGFFVFPEREEFSEHKILTIYCEESRLNNVPKLLMSDESMYKLINNGWAFHIRYNEDDNNIAIFDLSSYGMEIIKVERGTNELNTRVLC